jgi:RNA polymerase sigma-70 factor (ECF subfamily)
VPQFSEVAVTPHDAVPLDNAVRLAQQGDVDAFEAIYHASAPAVFALCRRMTGDDGEARELVQDVFVRAWERLAGFRGQSALATWLHRLAVNQVLERLRASRREADRLIEGDEMTYPAASGGLAMETRLDFEAALTRLPTGARTVLVLHLEGYSHDEIAQLTGIAAGTARAQLWRARRELTRWLDP